MMAFLAVVVLGLAGCTTIDAHKAPPATWPKLAVTEHKVSCPAMLGRCYQYLSLPMKLLGGVPIACAEVDLTKKTCDIWTCAITPKGAIEHEYDHCDGRDHHDDTTLADLLRNYRAAGGR